MTNKREENPDYALVTGASKGFGMHLALELAKRKLNLILVSLPDEGIKEVQNRCSKHGVKCVCYETDLTRKQNILELAQWVNENYRLRILINNAGTGETNYFHKIKLPDIETLVQLNVVAPTLLTHQLLPNLLMHDDAYVLNVSSMASFSPIGYKTVYSASKRYVQQFSRGLFQELRNTSVLVSVVHPGPMKTNTEVTKRIVSQGIIGKMGRLSPEKSAEITIRKLFKHKSQILLGTRNYLYRALLSFVPLAIRLPLMSHFAKRGIDV